MSSERLEEFVERVSERFGSIDEDQIMRWMKPHLISCDSEGKEITVSYDLEKRFANPSMKVLHGGMTAAFFDSGMGVLASYYGEHMVNTISLDTNYSGPIFVSEPLYIRAKVIKSGKTIIFTTAEAYQMSNPKKILATSSATYYVNQKEVDL